jgi:predicted ATPase
MTSNEARSNPLLLSARLRNLLSYGPDSPEIELKPLNVFIGPNGSGKSNFIEALSVLNAAPDDIVRPIRQGGGTPEWIWKGEGSGTACLEFIVNVSESAMPLRYRLAFDSVEHRFNMVDEVIEDAGRLGSGSDNPSIYYRFGAGQPELSYRIPTDQNLLLRRTRKLEPDEFEHGQSILKKKRDSFQFPEITSLAKQFEGIHIYRDWDFGRNSAMRTSVIPDLPADYLLPDASNLALVLNRFAELDVAAEVDELLKRYLASYMGYHTRVQGGRIHFSIKERWLGNPTPASRLSEGTLRFLCLLAVLCEPEPPPLVCIEEPELCQHPDLMPIITDLLVEASARTQLIVTTHSDILVDCLTEEPDSVIACENSNRGTILRRLDTPELRAWLEDYSLGELWRKGQIGGNRW